MHIQGINSDVFLISYPDLSLSGGERSGYEINVFQDAIIPCFIES